MKYLRYVLLAVLLALAVPSYAVDAEKATPAVTGSVAPTESVEKIDPFKAQLIGIIQDARNGTKDLGVNIKEGTKGAVEFIKTQGGKAVDIVSKEAPEVAHEIVILGALKAAACPVSWLIVFLVFAWYRSQVFGALEAERETYRNKDDGGFCFAAKTFYTIISFGILGLCFYNLFDVAYIVLAPRVYLLEYVAKLFGH